MVVWCSGGRMWLWKCGLRGKRCGCWWCGGVCGGRDFVVVCGVVRCVVGFVVVVTLWLFVV